MQNFSKKHIKLLKKKFDFQVYLLTDIWIKSLPTFPSLEEYKERRKRGLL